MRRLRSTASNERGFTMIAVTAAMLAIMGVTLTAFAAADGDQQGARYDQDHKRSYSAAEAGANEYRFHLNEDGEYWKNCNAKPWINQPWNGTGADPRGRRQVPGSDAEYTIELLPATPYQTCDPTRSETMIDSQTGTIRIRSTGFARGKKRSLITTFRRKGFLDFLYFTDLEDANPVTYRVSTGGLPTSPEDVQAWASRECSTHYWEPGGWGTKTFTGSVVDGGTTHNVSFPCTAINFVSGDFVRGPLHTNDEMLVCGTPTFGRDAQDAIEASSPAGWRGNPNSCGADVPNFQGRQDFGADILAPPPSNTSLKSVADPAYVFTGKTTIVLSATSLQVNGVTKAYPPNGVIYVQNGSCPLFYDPVKTEQTDNRCGDVYVRGSYGKDLTIAAEKDIVVTGPVTRTNDSLLGLIANNFVRVDHPVVNRTKTWNGSTRYNWDCDDGPQAQKPSTIEAAILALQHSFIVDNWYCGGDLGTLTVTGAIAQRYRGFVGTFGSANTGYLKNYAYDDRLRYRQPPHFLDPVQSAWRVVRQTEQTPPR